MVTFWWFPYVCFPRLQRLDAIAKDSSAINIGNSRFLEQVSWLPSINWCPCINTCNFIYSVHHVEYSSWMVCSKGYVCKVSYAVCNGDRSIHWQHSLNTSHQGPGAWTGCSLRHVYYMYTLHHNPTGWYWNLGHNFLVSVSERTVELWK